MQAIVRAVAAAAVLGAASTAFAQRHYTISELGSLGAASVFARDLSEHAVAVGSAMVPVPGSLIAHAFRSSGGRMEDLAPGLGISHAFGVNSAGQVAGAIGLNPVLWDGGAPNAIGLLPGTTQGTAFAVNDRGLVVGVAQGPSSMRAFSFHEGRLAPLPLPPGINSSAARAVNRHGTVAGSMGPTSPTRAAAWHGGPGVELEVLPHSVGNGAVGINDRDVIVGHAYRLVGGTGYPQPVRWTPRGDGSWRAEALLMPAGGLIGWAYDVNDHGRVVGEVHVGVYSLASLWVNGAFLDLNDLVPAGSPPLLAARAINRRGQIIVDAIASPSGLLLTPVPCQGDADFDGVVGLADSLAVIDAWGRCDHEGCAADLDEDGTVGAGDLVLSLGWGPCRL